MAIEQLIQVVLAASPTQRRELEDVLSGRTRVKKESNKVDTRLVTISGTARLLALGRNTVYRLIETGRLDTVELNGCSRVTMRSINEFLAGERPPTEKTAALVGESKDRYAKECQGKEVTNGGDCAIA